MHCRLVEAYLNNSKEANIIHPLNNLPSHYKYFPVCSCSHFMKPVWKLGLFPVLGYEWQFSESLTGCREGQCTYTHVKSFHASTNIQVPSSSTNSLLWLLLYSPPATTSELLSHSSCLPSSPEAVFTSVPEPLFPREHGSRHFTAPFLPCFKGALLPDTTGTSP